MTYPQLPGAVNLVLGQAVTPGPTGVDLGFGTTGVPPQGSTGVVNAKFALRASCTVLFDNAVARGVGVGFEADFDAAFKCVALPKVGWDSASGVGLASELQYEPAARTLALVQFAWLLANPIRPQAAVAWHSGQVRELGAQVGWHSPLLAQVSDAFAWDVSEVAGGAVAMPYVYGRPIPLSAHAAWDAARPLALAHRAEFADVATPHAQVFVKPWNRLATAVASYGGPIFLAPAPVFPPEPVDVVRHLRFCRPLQPYLNSFGQAEVVLIFGVNPCGGITPDSAFYILPSRSYLVINNVVAQRLPDGMPIPLESCSLSADVGSFCWSFSATGPSRLFSDLAPPVGGLPVQLQITVNGSTWVFAVEKIQNNRAFGKSGVSISGRSRTALLGAPWRRDVALANTQAQDAQQLAAQALDLTGVALSWGIADWLVPTGAFSFLGTPLAAVQSIAESAGGYLQSHRSLEQLQVRHPYPQLANGTPGGPWHWGQGVADVELAPDAVVVSGIERDDGPDINGVYVSGTSWGVNAFVKRTGTAGEKLAAPVSDPLITAQQAALQRGLAILGAGGAKHRVSLDLPVLAGETDPGVIDVGTLVQINDFVPWRGRVRSVSVQYQFPTVRQTITLERHL